MQFIDFTCSNRFAWLTTWAAAAYCIITTNVPAETNCVAPPAGLVSWWRAEGVAVDETGGNDGALAGNTTYVAGRVGQGLWFDGNADCLQLGSATNLWLQDLTIEAWIQRASPTIVSPSWGAGQFICCGTGGYNFGLDADNRPFFGKVNIDLTKPEASITDTNWHHVAVTKSGGTVVFYIDGVAYPVPAYAPVFEFPTPMVIGAHPEGYGYGFWGAIDELAVYGRPLTAVEIQALYTAGSAGKCVTGVPPAIFIQPGSQSVRAGDPTSFTVVAGGTTPLGYQWRFNGTNISGATSTALLLPSVQPVQGGDYSVVVSNAFGTVTSSNAVLTVSPAPPCAALPAGLISWWRAEGAAEDEAGGNRGTVTGGVAYAVGRVGQSFQFDGEGDAVTVGSAPNLCLQDFTIEAWIQRGSASILSYFYDGAAQLFSCGAQGYNFGIDADSRPFMGKVGVSLVKPVATIADTNWHHVAVVKSGSKVVFYIDGVAFPAPDYGEVFQFPSTAVAIGARPDTVGNSFLGRIDEVAVFSRPLAVSEVQALYAAGVAGKCVTGFAPGIFTQPVGQTVGAGDAATFATAVTGTTPLSCQWLLNGTNISGATTTALTLSNVQPSHAGSYSVVVSNSFGTITSSNATLTVRTYPPTITVQPTNKTVVAGGVATFSAAATGSPSLAYQWFLNNTILSGATKASLVLSNVATSQAGTYWVQVTNAYGSMDSSNAVLAVVNLGPNFFDDLEPGIETLQWSSFGGTVLATRYGGAVSGTNALWFGGNGTRYAVTRPLNTTAGGVIEFYLRLARGTSSTWETADLPQKGVVLEYSISGVAWNLLARYDTPSHTNWTFCSMEIPAAAKSPGTLFRWRQLMNSGSNYDHWALDDAGVFVSPRPPQITNQPASQAALLGQTVTFAVGVHGSLPLSYQWQFSGTNLNGATASTLALTNVQFDQAGSYAVVVTNAAGVVASSNALLTVSFPPATVQALDVNAGANEDVIVPLILVANGNENALGFSLNFNPAHLAYGHVTLGAGARGGSLLLNTSQLAVGRLWIGITLPSGTTFASGTQTIAQVNFTAQILTSATSSPIVFGDQPKPRELSDVLGNILPAVYSDGAVAIAPAEFEGDTSPRPGGSRTVTISDWVLAGRYAARLDYPTNAAEFRRADCAPRATLGDGSLRVTDWVQTGRYAAGLDSLTCVGGPTTEVVGAPSPRNDRGSQSSQVCATDVVFVQGSKGVLTVKLEAQGNEAGLGFSLMFDPARFTHVGTALGVDAGGASLNVNTLQTEAGRLGIALVLPPGNAFSSGTREVVKVTFTTAPEAVGNFAVTFGDQPIPRDVSDAGAATLSATFVNSTVVINPPPTLTIGKEGPDVVLSWPGWATNFALQTAGDVSPAGGWTNTSETPALINGINTVTLPGSRNTTFYRLSQP